jgi:hypothetical protein
VVAHSARAKVGASGSVAHALTVAVAASTQLAAAAGIKDSLAVDFVDLYLSKGIIEYLFSKIRRGIPKGLIGDGIQAIEALTFGTTNLSIDEA